MDLVGSKQGIGEAGDRQAFVCHAWERQEFSMCSQKPVEQDKQENSKAGKEGADLPCCNNTQCLKQGTFLPCSALTHVLLASQRGISGMQHCWMLTQHIAMRAQRIQAPA